MRKILHKYYYCVFFFFVGGFVILAGPLPAPAPPPPPPPPGHSIDGELVLLFGAALLFGFYTIYTSTLKNKRSV